MMSKLWPLAFALAACATGNRDVDPASEGAGGGGGVGSGDGPTGNAVSASSSSAGGGSAGSSSEVAQIPAPGSFVPGPDGFHIDAVQDFFDATQAFYATYADDYDFVVLYTDFLVPDLWQLTVATRADIGGIGIDTIYPQYYGWPVDQTQAAGSAGRLQAMVFMNSKELWKAAAFTSQDILTHEVGHRWGATILTPWKSDPTWLLDESFAHWSIVAGVGGPSALGYGKTVDNGDGTFTNTTVKPLAYSPLELYTMGLLPADAPELSDLFYVESPTQFVPPTDAAGTPWTHASLNGGAPVTFAGKRVDLSIDSITGALGPRTPAYPESQTSFRFAFVLLCRPDAPCAPDTVKWVEGERVAWEKRFADATGQRAEAITALH